MNGGAATEALADNGGPTLTYALPTDSLAVGHGPTGEVACKGTDQRGVPRTGPCDTGAYQYETCQKAVINVVGTDGRDQLQGSPGSPTASSPRAARTGSRPAPAPTASAVAAATTSCSAAPARTCSSGRAATTCLDGGPGKDRCVGAAGKDRQVSC